jgi:secreted trypsin-like serine protease
MKAWILLLVAAFIVIPSTATASLNGKEDYSEPRIMAVSLSEKIGSGPWANGSGYLYSPRIVFTAGHTKDNAEFKDLYVSQLNSKLKAGMETVKVVKKFFPATYSKKNYKDDFAILILEKPLAHVKDAPLITSELLAQAIAAKTPMKITGFGVYQDICLEKLLPSPCNFGGDRTSLVPRSIVAEPSTAMEIQSRYGRSDEEISDHLFMTGPHKSGACGGDSGGSTTVLINGTYYYVGTAPSGHWNAYACGQSGGEVGDTIGYTAPVFKFLDLIAAAEKYVAEHPYSQKKGSTEPKTSPAPKAVNKYQYISDLARSWAKSSTASDSALVQCKSARDRGLIYKNGKAVALGARAKEIRRDLNVYPGFKACLSGFEK